MLTTEHQSNERWAKYMLKKNFQTHFFNNSQNLKCQFKVLTYVTVCWNCYERLPIVFCSAYDEKCSVVSTQCQPFNTTDFAILQSWQCKEGPTKLCQDGGIIHNIMLDLISIWCDMKIRWCALNYIKIFTLNIFFVFMYSCFHQFICIILFNNNCKKMLALRFGAKTSTTDAILHYYNTCISI